MEIGTAETIIEKDRKPKLKRTSGSGPGASGGKKNPGGGGNNGDDDNFSDNDFAEEIERNSSNKLRISMWIILLVVFMTFAGLVAAYVVVSTNGVLEWKPFDLPRAVWVSTALILASSLAYKISQKALSSENQQKAKNWLMVTTVLGAAFISSQILAWFALVRRGVYVQSNPYAGFFYILTAVHAVHVLGGIIVLGYIVLRTWNETSSDSELAQRKNISKTVGWYWHFMDALWIGLFLLLGFYK